MARPSKPLDPSASQAARLGAAIRHRREELGVIQVELAEMIHFSRTHLVQVELGKAHASEEFVRRCDDALQADGRLLAIYQEVVIERTQQRQQRTLHRRSDSAPRSGRPLRLVPSQGETVNQTSGSAEPIASPVDIIDQHTATSFFGGTRPTITMPLRTLGTGRYVIAQEDFDGRRRARAVLAWARARTRLPVRFSHGGNRLELCWTLCHLWPEMLAGNRRHDRLRPAFFLCP